MISKISRNGFLYTIGIAINRIVPAWLFRFRRFAVLQMDLDKLERYSVDDSPNVDLPVEFSLISKGQEIGDVEKLTYVDAQKLNHNFVIAQAKTGNQLAGALWGIESEFNESELGITFTLKDDQRWLFAALVDSQFRGQRIYPRLLKHMCSQSTDGSVKYLLCVNPHNKPSWNAHQKFAQQKLGEVFSLRIFNVALCVPFGKRLKMDALITRDAKNRPVSLSIRSL